MKWDTNNRPKLNRFEKFTFKKFVNNIHKVNNRISKIEEEEKRKKALIQAISTVPEIVQVVNEKNDKPLTDEELNMYSIEELQDIFEEIIEEMEKIL